MTPQQPHPLRCETIVDEMMKEYSCIFFPLCWKARELLYCPKKAGKEDCTDYRASHTTAPSMSKQFGNFISERCRCKDTACIDYKTELCSPWKCSHYLKAHDAAIRKDAYEQGRRDERENVLNAMQKGEASTSYIWRKAKSLRGRS